MIAWGATGRNRMFFPVHGDADADWLDEDRWKLRHVAALPLLC
jgi:hypothetical protein